MGDTIGHQPAPEQIIEQRLDESLELIGQHLAADPILLNGPLLYGTDDAIRDHIEAITPKQGRLAVLLETDGGLIEVVQRIADTLRHHYESVDFIVPNYAMSAGTVLVMSGDRVYMDYYSILGPIDPQVKSAGGQMVPALGYLEQYKRLIAKSEEGLLTTAELTFLLKKFDPAELYRYEQAAKLSITLLKEWLAQYKFRDWKQTQTKKSPVTQKLRQERAAKIARQLTDTGRWHSHGRGISMEVLRRELNLRVEDFGENVELSRRIRSYYKLLQHYKMIRGHSAVLHRVGHYLPLRGD